MAGGSNRVTEVLGASQVSATTNAATPTLGRLYTHLLD